MRLRIRGPSGQSTATLDETATIEVLKKTISTQTSLSSFDIKYGYPPKPLSLERYPSTTKLTNLDIKLNGEQLIVTSNETTTSGGKVGHNDKSSSANVITSNDSNTAEPSASRTTATTPSTSRTPDEDTPLNLTRKANKAMLSDTDPPEIPIPDLGGTLVLRIMPDDNSCLFRAISSAVMSGEMDAVTELRDIVAQTIQSDQGQTYTSAILDNKSPDAYCRWIKSPNSWGGQVELSILSQYFNTEICSIDVQTLRVDRYHQPDADGQGGSRRCFVVYSGIHYDVIALSLQGLESMSGEEDVKVFEDPIGEEVLPKAVELCRLLQQRHYFTDTSGFRVRCGDCGVVVKGEKGATEHAKTTGHYNFGEAE